MPKFGYTQSKRYAHLLLAALLVYHSDPWPIQDLTICWDPTCPTHLKVVFTFDSLIQLLQTCAQFDLLPQCQPPSAASQLQDQLHQFLHLSTSDQVEKALRPALLALKSLDLLKDHRQRTNTKHWDHLTIPLPYTDRDQDYQHRNLTWLFGSNHRQGEWDRQWQLLRSPDSSPHPPQPTTSPTPPQTAQADLADSLHRSAIGLFQNGRYTQAESHLQRALTLKQNLYGPDHPDVADLLDNLARVYLAQCRYLESERAFHQALSIRTAIHPPRSVYLAYTRIGLADLYLEQKRFQEAEPLYQQALSILEPDQHPYLVLAWSGFAHLQTHQGNYSQAEAIFHKAIDLAQTHYGPMHLDLLILKARLATLYLHQPDRQEDAATLFQETIQATRQLYGSSHPLIPTLESDWALLLLKQGHYSQAETLLLKAIRTLQPIEEQPNPTLANSLNSLGLLYVSWGFPHKAESVLNMSLRLWQHLNLPTQQARCLHDLARLYHTLGQFSPALDHYLKALELLKSTPPPDAETLQVIHNLKRLQQNHEERRVTHAGSLRYLQLQ